MANDHTLDYDDPWQATAALIFLVTQWSQSHSVRLVPLILEHLAILEHHASRKLSPIMREVCRGVQDNWSLHGEPTPPNQVEMFTDLTRDRSSSLH